MTTQDIIDKILAKNPEVTKEKILEQMHDGLARSGGLLGDETLLRLIAARYGVEVEQNGIRNSGTLPINRLLAGLNDVSVAGRCIAVYPVKTFEGEKPGKFATLLLLDKDGILRVVLWNEKADLVESRQLEVGLALKLLHGYTREDRYGKVELHLGGKSKIEVEPNEKASEYPDADKFSVKINTLTASMGTVILCGRVKQVSALSSFTRADSTDGFFMRFVLADESGQVTAVAWNEKATELQKKLKVDARLQLINARVKEAQSGGVEVHVDSNTCANVSDVSPDVTP